MDDKIKQTTTHYKDIYDTIIENATKEWFKSMAENIINSTSIPTIWEVPSYSRNQIDKAGKKIATKSYTEDEFKNALPILNNWRSSHAYPLQEIANNLRINNPDAIVVQRLKRLDSIIAKLQRKRGTSLYTMQDLGGCRVIVESIVDVYKALNDYKSSGIKHILKKENDYIKEPKESGYRSYHMVYEFKSEIMDSYNKNILIEIQFRTKLQHIWATAVEVMGIYTKSQLKASIGDEDILRFFVLVSSIFAKMEHTPICPNTTDDKKLLIKELKELDKKHNIISRLSAINVAINHTNEKMKGMGYYLLRLNFQEQMLKISGFQTEQVEAATNAYNQIESFNDPNIDAVLVSATSFDELKDAYPNYFTDISKFVSIMRNLLKQN